MTPEDLALKRATAEMVRGVGGVEAGAAFCRVGKSQLSDYQSVNRAECFVPLDVVAALEPLARDRAGWPHVTSALCQRMGGSFVAMPEVPPGRRDLCTLIGEQAVESAELTTALMRALGDGRCDPHECDEPLREARELLAKAATIIVALEAIKAGDRE